jgi:MarR-like DNA-binding transcriptional regulator SgrR of sgrS sRNA
VLLQRQAEAAESFLPQWLSGYAFVFRAENNVERGKAVSGPLTAGASGPGMAWPAPLRLRVDAGGDLAKLIAERVAINARQAGIAVQVQVQAHSVTREVISGGAASAGKTAEMTGLRLVAWRYSSLSERAELEAMVSTLHLETAADEKEKAAEDAEQLYVRERRLIEERELIPLVVLPDYIGLGAEVRDWMAERWGEWHLADVWLDGRTGGLRP